MIKLDQLRKGHVLIMIQRFWQCLLQQVNGGLVWMTDCHGIAFIICFFLPARDLEFNGFRVDMIEIQKHIAL